jgi:hypothetical protein
MNEPSMLIAIALTETILAFYHLRKNRDPALKGDFASPFLSVFNLLKVNAFQ